MFLNPLRFGAVVLTALGLSLGVAHALELPPRMNYDGPLYLAVTSTLYRMYAIAGGAFQVGSLLAVALLCRVTRGRPSFRLTLAALAALALSLAVWAAVVRPVNAEWGRVLRSQPSAAPEAYLRLRPRWEFGHVAAGAVWLAGFSCLVLSVLSEIPPRNKTRAAG